MIQYEIRSGAYYDSVVLMQLQKALVGLDGVLDAGVVMATAANKEVLAASGLLPENVTAKADDLLIVVKGKSEQTAKNALTQVNDLLKQRSSGTTQDFRPKSLATAVSINPAAQWVLVSVPGRYAAGVADEALDLGKHVFLYSDNVSVEEEVRLKQKAQRKGLLVMGPDCGTAVINGIGLGFANRVRQGSIGIIAASGTGLQAVSTEIHNLGGGVSQAIGTGGRDLKEAVGGVTAKQALDLLARDENTAVIVLISKPPSAAVAAELLGAAQNCGKPVVINFIGYTPPGRRIGRLLFAADLYDAADHAVKLSHVYVTLLPDPDSAPQRMLTGNLRGLFSGGTLAAQILLGLQAVLTPIYSNIPLHPEQTLDDVMTSKGHTILDLGEDEFTQGRLHPMMDNDLRLRRLQQETADPDVDMILLDIVLGEGSHPDPAAEMAPAVARAVRHGKRVVVIVVGTEEDPQDIHSQIAHFTEAGAVVFPNVKEALDHVYNRIPSSASSTPVVDISAFAMEGLTAVNVGLESFADSINEQGGTAVQVEWRPPAGGNEKLMAILAKMKQKS